jgi:hypothetical protein
MPLVPILHTLFFGWKFSLIWMTQQTDQTLAKTSLQFPWITCSVWSWSCGVKTSTGMHEHCLSLTLLQPSLNPWIQLYMLLRFMQPLPYCSTTWLHVVMWGERRGMGVSACTYLAANFDIPPPSSRLFQSPEVITCTKPWVQGQKTVQTKP